MSSDVSEQRLAEAAHYLDEAVYLYNEKISNLHVLTKLYHAMIYSLMALFSIRDIGDRTHADIIERFEREYVRTGVFDPAILESLRFAYDVTHECDCAHMKQPDDRDIEGLLPAAGRLVREVGALLHGD
ncbi:MAG: hypothetical protein GXO94_00600 [Nitrospirae bacterium]|nr:hypothetical protein [Nitrospirota bacterium]